jgi:hypothetical protein
MVSRTEIGSGPNSNAGSHASEWEEEPSAGTEEVSVLPLFFRGPAFLLPDQIRRGHEPLGGGSGGSCSAGG